MGEGGGSLPVLYAAGSMRESWAGPGRVTEKSIEARKGEREGGGEREGERESNN